VKKILGLTAIMVFAALSAAPAFGQAPSIQSLDPFHFGPGGLSGWQIGAGNPATGDSQNWGLYLQKGVPTATLTAAGADVVLKNVPSLDSLTVLSFDISGLAGQPFGVGTAYCGAGAPRFNLVTTGGTCFLGCAHDDKTQNPTSGWWTISFTPPFTEANYPGCGAPSGTISSLSIVMDEGTDLGPGNVVIDEITINSRIFKKP
jgi:hypothetical protein